MAKTKNMKRVERYLGNGPYKATVYCGQVPCKYKKELTLEEVGDLIYGYVFLRTDDYGNLVFVPLGDYLSTCEALENHVVVYK